MAGVRTGSIEKLELRTRGVVWMRTGDIMLCRTVETKIFPGQTQDGSWPSSWTRPRRGAFVDMRISLVLVSDRKGLGLPAVLTLFAQCRGAPALDLQ